jgi:hypothetical protein
VVVCDRRDVGWWTRRERGRGTIAVTIALATSVTDEQRRLVEEAAQRLADFTGRQLGLELAHAIWSSWVPETGTVDNQTAGRD